MVKEKFVYVVVVFEKFKEVYFDDQFEVKDVGDIVECCDYLLRCVNNFGVFCFQVDDWIVVDEYRFFLVGF